MMWNKIKNSRWFYIVLSIILAVAFWVYIRAVVNPTATNTFYNVPITVVGEDVLAANGLMISNAPATDVEVQIKGKANSIVKVFRSNITVSVDVSRITEAGDYSFNYDITLPAGVSASSVSAECKSPSTYDITVSSVYSKSVTVEPHFTGSIATNYQAGEITVLPELITITGEESLVSQIDHAQVLVDTQNLKQSIAEDMPFELVCTDGTVVDRDSVTCNVDSVFVSMPVSMVKEVKLTVALVPGGGATEENVSYTISPETVRVSGPEEALSSLKEISLGEIHLAEVISSDMRTFPINLDPSLTNISGISTATVSISVDGLTRDVLSTQNISIINVPEGYWAESLTQELNIQIRGPKEAVDQVVSSQLRVVADLSGMESAEGQYTVPVSVYLDGNSDVGIVGEYTIFVKVSK